jgi:hypothetical protein
MAKAPHGTFDRRDDVRLDHPSRSEITLQPQQKIKANAGILPGAAN